VGALGLFEDAIAEIAARLDLREPNADAVRTLAAEVSQHYDVEERRPPFEAVIDSATGVGKTYILAGAMEFFAIADDVRDFVIVTPGRTILQKTRDNFTPGHPKSLIGPMSFRPVVISADNFNTPVMRAAMDDPTQVKVYLFTVQYSSSPSRRSAGGPTSSRKGSAPSSTPTFRRPSAWSSSPMSTTPITVRRSRRRSATSSRGCSSG